MGTPLEWADAEKYADHVREHGITQFLHIWDKLRGRVGDGLLWGDEVSMPFAGVERLVLFGQRRAHYSQ